MKKTLAAVALLTPLLAFALDFSGEPASRYSDARSLSMAEEVAVGMLTDLDVIKGNPNGTFAPRRSLNRAEFSAIAMRLLRLQGPTIQGFEPRCFPDVPADSWFEADVCTLKQMNIVRGYGDGRFHPERQVTYAEALKILAEVYDLELGPTDPLVLEAWYQTYIRAATREGLTLAGPEHDTPLTRAQVARLAAAFHAWSEDELDAYRRAEEGRRSSASSSSASFKMCGGIAGLQCGADQTCVDDPRDTCDPASGGADCAGICVPASASSSSRSSTASSQSSTVQFPVKSQFLLLGQRSPPVASATYFSELEPVHVREVAVTLVQPVTSVSAMYLVDEYGAQLATLSRDSSDSARWTGNVSGTYEIPQRVERTLGIEVRLKDRDNGGESAETLQVDSIDLTVWGVWREEEFIASITTSAFTKHQTAQGRITSVKNAVTQGGVVPVGSDQMVAAFAFSGSAVAPARLHIEQLEFTVARSSSVTLTNWRLGVADSNARTNCSAIGDTVTCSSIPSDIGQMQGSTVTVRLFADVVVAGNAINPFLQISLNDPGSVDTPGAVRWTDGSGDFHWIATGIPIARSVRWE